MFTRRGERAAKFAHAKNRVKIDAGSVYKHFLLLEGSKRV
jgi:hypothetical protein